MKFYTKHKPVIRPFKPGSERMLYEKFEKDDNFLHRKTGSISIAAKVLEQVDAVAVHIEHRNVVVALSKEKIKENSSVLTFNEETKYYCPVDKWYVHSGDADWTKKLKL